MLKNTIHTAAKMLDKEIPGWYNLVNPETLKMANCSMCVLGQVFGIPMEERLRGILGDACPPLHESQHHVPDTAYLRGAKYLYSRGQSPHVFGTTGTCEWVEEIAERKAREETDG